MKFKAAESLVETYKHLVGTRYKDSVDISALFILKKDAEINHILHAVLTFKELGEHIPDLRIIDFDVYVIYDLDKWKPGDKIGFNLLTAQIIHISHHERPS